MRVLPHHTGFHPCRASSGPGPPHLRAEVCARYLILTWHEGHKPGRKNMYMAEISHAASPQSPLYTGAPAVAPARGAASVPPTHHTLQNNAHTGSLAKDLSLDHDRRLVRRSCRQRTENVAPSAFPTRGKHDGGNMAGRASGAQRESGAAGLRGAERGHTRRSHKLQQHVRLNVGDPAARHRR